MVPMLLVGHGPLAAGLHGAVEMICGEQEAFDAVPLRPEDDVEGVARRVDAALRAMDCPEEDDALIFADLFGAAPAYAAAMLLRTRPNLEIVAGMNLPMVLDALLSREGKSARELCEQAVASGKESIRDVGQVIRDAMSAAASAGAAST
jgi:mannose/fructose/sorbose-specific phosphotransferase system IIA component